jgi:RNA polymerase sigma-70 factor (ECF subfamily)
MPAGPHHSTLSDDDLLLHYRRTGDAEWLGRLLQRYTVLLLGVAMKYLKEKEAAHDAVQAVFLKALTHLPSGEIQNFKGWLYILTRNYCLQHLRDHHHTGGGEVLERLPDTDSDGKKEAILREQSIENLETAIGELGEEQRISVTLFYLQKMSYADITARTGYSFAQVKSYIQNGKRNLKLILQKRLDGQDS